MNQRKPRRRRMAMESLERRQVLATVSFQLSMLSDTPDGPAEPITSHEIEVGDSFYLAIDARENTDHGVGLGGVAVNVEWDPQVFKSLDTDIQAGELVTDHLPLFNVGTLDNESGELKNLNGLSSRSLGAGRPIGDGVFENFALLHFVAVGDSDASGFRLTEGGSQIVIVPTQSVRSGDIQVISQPIRVVADQTTDPAPTLSDGEISIDQSSTLSDADAQTTSPDPLPEQTTVSAQTGPEISVSLVDANDSPIIEIEQGQSFSANISVTENDPSIDGVGGLAVDVQWDPSTLRLSSAEPIEDAITDNFPAFRGAEVDAEQGIIRELSGASFESNGLGRAIGDGTTETFATLEFDAIASAEAASITVSVADGGIGLVGDTSGEQIRVEDAVSTFEIATAALPPLIEVSTSGAADRLEFGTALRDGSRSTFVRPGSSDTMQFIEISNVGETILEVYEIRLNTTGLAIAAADLDAIDGFSLAAGDSRRINLEFSANSDGDVVASEGISIISNAGNRDRYAIAAVAQTTFAADMNFDGRVNVADVVLLDTLFGSTDGDDLYWGPQDPNQDGSIDLGDFGLLNAQYGLRRNVETTGADLHAADKESSDEDDIFQLLALDALKSA